MMIHDDRTYTHGLKSGIWVCHANRDHRAVGLDDRRKP
jgi:hypothetical protein